MKSLFNYFSDIGIKVSWTLVSIGLGFIDYKYRIKPDEIKEYACEKIIGNSNIDESMDILFLNNNSFQEIQSIINKLASKENVDSEFEKRKWILYVVDSAISQLPEHITNEDLFELGDLYGYLDHPDNYPVDGKYFEYIKCGNIPAMIEDHKKWIENETSCIKAESGFEFSN